MKTTFIISFAYFVIFDIYKVESCTTNQFQCADGQCIPSEKQCDDTFDCGDRSDEVNCSNANQCPEGLHRCYNGQCVTDLNLCPTPTLIHTSTEVYSISTSQLQTSSSVGIAATSSLYMSKSSVIETTTASGAPVNPTTEDHAPDGDNSNLLYLLFLLLLIPISLAACIIYCRYEVPGLASKMRGNLHY